ncbi:hypothetical protein SY88_07690 [Clostridiales bacterium PH28_bin88]|nr:hypothetical protein SY88_07690 [Clostridiales bacterium PH28_bin88]
MSKRGLGKGLQALIPPSSMLTDEGERVFQIPVNQIEPSSYQPRRLFDEEKLEELALSIKEHGVVQPIVVRRSDKGMYELVAGERRWRACRRLEMETIPAVIKDMTDMQTTEVALIENIQREDLNPLEEAWAYRTLLEEFELTQEELARRVGKSRPYIANTVRLLQLPEKVKELVGQGYLTAGHGRALLGLPHAEDILRVSEAVKEKGLNVRETEEMVRKISIGKGEKSKRAKTGKITRTSTELVALEESLQDYLGTKVRLRPQGQGGRIEIEFYGEEDLTRIIDLLIR